MIMKQLIFFSIFLTSVKSQTISLKPNASPILSTCPCKGDNDIVVQFEPGVQPIDNNRYYIYVNKQFSKDCKLKIVFDSRVIITYVVRTEKNEYSRKSLPKADTFSLRFTKPQVGFSFIVKGTERGITPYLLSFSANGVEYCKNPIVGFLDQYAAKSCGRKVRQTIPLEDISSPKSPANYSGPTVLGDWPWHVALQRLTESVPKYQCGGTLISKNLVLTAAHCVAKILSNKPLSGKIRVLLGKYDLKSDEATSQEMEVLDIIIPENYLPSPTLFNDIALLKLKTDVIFNDFIQPACLWQSDDDMAMSVDKNLGTIVGWGYDDSNVISQTLLQASLPKVSDLTCVKTTPILGPLLNGNNFCAGGPDVPGPCRGDSGGAFQIFIPDDTQEDPNEITGKWHITGVLSTGGRDCEEGSYSVFTDVAKFKDWIDRYLQD